MWFLLVNISLHFVSLQGIPQYNMYATVHQFFILRIHLIELQIPIVDEGTLRYCGNG